MSGEPSTLLKKLCDDERLTYRKFHKRFIATGIQLYGNKPDNPTLGEQQFRKWTGGKLVGLPADETCTILERMFPGYTAKQLFGPPDAAVDPQAPADLEERIEMTARKTFEGADATASASISDTDIEEIRDQVATLARTYHTKKPLEAFTRAEELCDAAEGLRDRTQMPAQLQQLMIVNGQAAALLAAAAFDLGNLRQARTIARAAAKYGEMTRFGPLQAFADGALAYIAYHLGESGEAVAKAHRALSYGGLGDVGQSRLYAIQARAYAHVGDVSAAQQAIRLSQEAGAERVDDLHDAVGGEFGFTPERLAMSNSTTALIIGDSAQAEADARRALELLSRQPQDTQSAHVRGGAAADLALARLLAEDVEGAAEALTQVWSIPKDQRMTGIVVRTSRIHRQLARPKYHGAQSAVQLREQIEHFTRMSPPYRIGPHVALLAIEA